MYCNMDVYRIFFLLMLFEKGKSENSPVLGAQLLEKENIIKELDNEMYFDIGKKLKSNHYKEPVAEKCERKSDLLSIQLENYIMRYIRVFLFVMNLQDKETLLKDDEETTIDLKFVINGKDLKFMKDMSENFKAGNILDKLYKLDAILSAGFKQPLLNEKDGNFFHTVNDYPKFILNSFIISKDLHFAIFLCCIAMLLIIRTYSYFPFWTSVFTSLNFLIISEGYIRYLIKLKDIEAENIVRFMDNTIGDCHIEKKSLFSKIWNILNPFGDDKCQNYLTSMNTKSADIIFPLESILDVYKFYFVEIPSRMFGSCIRYISEELHGNLPTVLKYFVIEVTYPFIFIFFFSLIVLFMKPRLNLRGYGFNFGLGFAEDADRIENNRNTRRLEDAESVETNRIQNLAGSLAGGSGKKEEQEREREIEQEQGKIACPGLHKFQVSNNDQVSEYWKNE